MTLLKIKINSLKDAEQGKGVIEGLTRDQIKETEDVTIAILEGGTQSGQISLMFLLKNDDGTTSVAQITENHFSALCSAFIGAKERFELDKATKN